jgi:CelD/BcsL family acetyltransferase involved in cellulose biosynthesis
MTLLAETVVESEISSGREAPAIVPAAVEPIRVERVTSLADLDAIEDAWCDLNARRGGPMEQFAWVRSCAATLSPSEKLEVTTLWRGGRLVAAAPMVLSKRRGIPRLNQLGVDRHYEPMDMLYVDDAARDALIASLAEYGGPFALGRVREDSPTIEAIQKHFAGNAHVQLRPQIGYPYIDLDDSWRDPEQKLSAKRRSDLRRAHRRAEEAGPVTTEIITPAPQEVDALLSEAFAVEMKSWKGKDGTAMACDESEAMFCRAYARAACHHGVLRLCFLRIGGVAAAMHIAMVHGGGFWLLKIGYDESFARCSPGMLLIQESIAYAAREGLKTYEFLGKSEAWIEMWSRTIRPCTAVRVYPYGSRGMAALAVDGVAHAGLKLSEKTMRLKPASFTAAAKAKLRRGAKALAVPVMKCVAQKYIAGDKLSDALAVQSKLAQNKTLATIGFWDSSSHCEREVADQYLAGIDALASNRLGGYLSIKLPAIGHSQDLVDEIGGFASEAKVRLHFDGMDPESVDRTKTAIDNLRKQYPGLTVGTTLPGRWLRSAADADWVVERQLPVRVVKGEWPDSAAPDRDLRAGYLEVIDRLAGRAKFVSVASHDPPLVEEAIRRLQAAGAPCDIELLYGLPMRGVRKLAEKLNVGLRVYVPYGVAYMPYALGQVRRKPRILLWLARDFFSSLLKR